MSGTAKNAKYRVEYAWQAYERDPTNPKKRAKLIKAQKAFFAAMATEGLGVSRNEARNVADLIFGSGAGILLMHMAMEDSDADA